MADELDRDLIIRFSMAMAGRSDITSMLEGIFPIIQEITNCSVVSVFKKENEHFVREASFPRFSKRCPIHGQACSGFFQETEANPSRSFFYSTCTGLNCYGFRLGAFHHMMMCSRERFSITFLEKISPVLDILGIACDRLHKPYLSEDSGKIDSYVPQARQRSLLDNLPFMVWMQDKNGILAGVNKHFAEACDLEIKDIIGRHPEGVVPSYLYKKIKNYFDPGLEAHPKGFEHCIGRDQGDIWIQVSRSFVVGYDGEYLGSIGFIKDNSLERQDKARLLEIEEIFSQLEGNIEIAFWLRERDRLLYVSPGVERIFGLNFTDLVNDPLAIFNTVHFQDRDRVIQTMDYGFFSKDVLELEFRLNRPGGDIGWAKIRSFPVRDENGNIVRRAGIAEDITEAKQVLVELEKYKTKLQEMVDSKTRALVNINHILEQEIIVRRKLENSLNENISELKEAENKICKSEKRLKMVVDNLPVLIHAHDDKGNFVFWNKESERSLGYTRDEMLNNYGAFSLLYPKEEAMRKAMSVYDDPASSWPIVVETYTKTGQKRIIEWTRLSEKYPIPGWNDWEVGVDITNRRKAEMDLKKARDEAREANDAKSRFLANMSHEIRTPLSGIIGLARLAVEDEKHSDQTKPLSKILILSEHLLQVINEILDLSKVEAGKYYLKEKEFNLDVILESVYNALIHKARDKGIDLTLDKDRDVPVNLSGDDYCLMQVLLNIVGNAVKFTSDGSVKIKVRQEKKETEKVDLIFEVSDTGIGIPEDMHDRIFGAFTQIDEGYSRKFAGTGLGLAICKELVSLMSGQIRLISTPGKGSVFIISIPFNTFIWEDAPSLPEQENIGAHPGPLKILLVDDFEINQEVFQEMLERQGHEVDVRENGQKALEALVEKEYDLVLMDLQMPVMDGLEATEHIRNHSDLRIRNIPVIALTAHTVDKHIELAMKAGMNGYLLKPSTINEIQTAIADLFNNA